MGREIKFRAWDEEYKRFMEIVSLEMDFMYQNKKHIAVWRKPYDFENSTAISFRAKINQTILMQYTGLKDKNGTEVYEGDIVKWSGRICKISYYLAHFVLEHKLTKECRKLSYTFQDCEVIGNIYENQELFKTKT